MDVLNLQIVDSEIIVHVTADDLAAMQEQDRRAAERRANERQKLDKLYESLKHAMSEHRAEG